MRNLFHRISRALHTRRDLRTIQSILARYEEILGRIGYKTNIDPVAHRITHIHFNVTPIRLNDLLGAPEDEFVREVVGYQRNFLMATNSFVNEFDPHYVISSWTARGGWKT